MKLLVTGGAGFIGSNFVQYVLDHYPDDRVVVLDKLTYAGNLDNLLRVQDSGRCSFYQGDINDEALVERLVPGVDAVLNFAAETHVDRSILDASAFIQTDVRGTWVLLEAARRHGTSRFVQISTDEVYGHVPQGSSREDDKLAPRSPYAASKAGAELLVQASWVTYGLPSLITRGANTIGPYQYPEKAVPLFATNALDGQPLPIYGDGRQRRDWLYVDDHCAAIDLVLRRGAPGEAYNVGAGNERENLDVARTILALLGKPESLLQFVADRPGHDRRYCLDSTRLRALGWAPRHDFQAAMERTVAWYQRNEWWWRKLKTGEYLEYYRRNYEQRHALLRSS
ncbi:MAG: dTDP-glucose 4,6-dehydratase [Chloroflexi bacterium]|nr:dTDP-glucose 4,6-dehydratase [Chloroflexota bacterium]